MDYKDYYKALGVSKSATPEEIRAAFKKLAMKYHPDRNQGDAQSEEKFKEVNEAYQVLSDQEKRQRYDQLGSAYFDYQRGGGQPNGFDWGRYASQSGGQTVDFNDLFGDNGGFSDFFSAFFGGAGGANSDPFRRNARPQHYEQAVTISLSEAYHGTARIIEGPNKKLEVKLPAGARTGTKVRVQGGAPNGSDLYLKIVVADDNRFKREGNDLYITVTIDVFTAMLGGECEIVTLSGRVMLTIPAGTQPDQKFRVQKRGMPQLKDPNSFGDLYVQVKVQIPKHLNPDQKEMIIKAREKQA